MFKLVTVGLTAIAIGYALRWKTESAQAFVLTDGILGLIGVFVGLFMSTFLESFKNFLQKRSIKRSLMVEMELNLSLIPHKTRVLRSTKTDLTNGALTPPKTFFFATAIYDQSFKIFSDGLSAKEVQSLHFIREYCRIIDWSIENFFDQFKADLSRKPPEEVAGMYQDFADDIIDQLAWFKKYLIRHLAGDPISVDEVVGADEARRSAS